MSIGRRIMNCSIKKPVVGIEPTTGGLQNRCSAAELHRLKCHMKLYRKDTDTNAEYHCNLVAPA